jgi:hypothetical protein
LSLARIHGGHGGPPHWLSHFNQYEIVPAQNSVGNKSVVIPKLEIQTSGNSGIHVGECGFTHRS